MPVYQPLERFLTSLGLTIVTRLYDSESFVKAAETGVGIFEMDPLVSAAERDQFLPIVTWVDPQAGKAATPPRVIELPRVAQARSTISVPAFLRRS